VVPLREAAVPETQANGVYRQALCHRPPIEHTAAMNTKELRSLKPKLGQARGTPNPSIEGTSTSGLRPLAAAPHVKR
jgi:hypothetical protein